MLRKWENTEVNSTETQVRKEGESLEPLGHTWSPLARSQEKLLYWLTMHFDSSRNLWVESGVHQSFMSPSLS